jgi:hypothetical protein
MGSAARHVHQTLQSKIGQGGRRALTWAESRLIRASRFLIAVDSNTLPSILLDLSRSELFETSDALSAIGATSTSNSLLQFLRRDEPSFGAEKAAQDMNALAATLSAACKPNREADEIRLLKFSFEHSEWSGPARTLTPGR